MKTVLPASASTASIAPAASIPRAPETADRQKLRETFQSVLGQTFYGQMLHAMRRTQGKPAYFHGGRAEEVFQQQLDQVLAEKMSRATAEQFAGPAAELFMMNRK